MTANGDESICAECKGNPFPMGKAQGGLGDTALQPF